MYSSFLRADAQDRVSRFHIQCVCFQFDAGTDLFLINDTNLVGKVIPGIQFIAGLDSNILDGVGCGASRRRRNAQVQPIPPDTFCFINYRHSASAIIASSDVHRGSRYGCLWLSTDRPSLLVIKMSSRVSSGKMLVTPLKV